MALSAALVAGCSGQSTSTSKATATSSPTSVSSANELKAAAFIVGKLKEGDHVETKYGPDAGQTADVALGLIATKAQEADLAKVMTYLEANAPAYVHGDPKGGEKADAHYAGPTGKLALLATVAGKDPAAFGGLDLIKELTALMDTKGRFSDSSAFGDFSNPLGQSFDILALQRGTTEGAPKVAVDFLLTAQCGDGGFADAFPKAGAACVSSPDATGLALQALAATASGCPAIKAATWLNDNVQSDGSFVSKAVDPSAAAAGNVNSTAYAALGLNAAGKSNPEVANYLESVQNTDGGLAIQPSGKEKTSDVFATAVALNALAQSSFLTIGASPMTPAALVCAQTPTGT